MTDYFPTDERVRYGLALEPVLRPKLSEFLEDDIKKVEYQYSNLDFVGAKTWSELKVRTSDYHHTDRVMREEGWLIPACKVFKAKELYKKKDIFFFYLWERDGSLWAMKYDPSIFETLVPRVPSWHHDRQLHYYIPQHEWKLIDFLKIDGKLKRKQCLINDDD